MKVEKNNPLARQQKQPGSTTKIILGVITALAVLITIGLPAVIQLLIVDALKGQGADQVSIGDVDINLFTGKFSIHQLLISTKEHPALTVETLSINAPYWQALNNQITVKQIFLRNALIPIVQQRDGSTIIGLPLASNPVLSTEERLAEPLEQPPAEQPPAEKAGFNINGWQFMLQQLQVENVTLRFITATINNALEIHSLQLNDLTNGSNQRSELSVVASIVDLREASNIKMAAQNIHLNSSQAITYEENSKAIMFDPRGELSIESMSLQYENLQLETQLQNAGFAMTLGYAPDNVEPLSWYISSLKLNQFEGQFTDDNIKPMFSTDFEIQSLALGPVDNQLPDRDTAISLDATIDSYSVLSAAGTVKPLAKKISADLKVSMTSLELVPFSAYIEPAIGYHIQTGKLNLDADINVSQDQLDSKAGITLNNIKLVPATDGAAEKLARQLIMPLDQALSLLRDDDNNVEVDIPILGDIKNPQFKINDVLKQAAAKATKYAAVTVLKNTLLPQATLISIAEFAYDQGKSLAALKLEPLIFIPEQLDLNNDQNNYLKKLAELAQQRPELRIRFCAVGYFAISASTPDDENQVRKFRALERATQLANKTRHVLIEKFDTNPEQLFRCQSTIESVNNSPTEAARVNLLL
ncbi:MAG: DUF748 domain-containing protein [Pseudomonadales bacterium]|nr:DUF748 domain-containing protein [Pseudomonadales bacterium]